MKCFFDVVKAAGLAGVAGWVDAPAGE